MPTVKKLQFANGVVVVEPEDLTLEASTNKLPTYADDAAYDAAHDVTEGSIYLNSTLKAPRMYLGGVWRTGIMQSNAADATKQVVLDTDGSTTGKTNTLDFDSTDNRVYTFPDATGTVVLTLGAQEIQDKTIKNGFLDGTKIRNGAIDVEAAGSLTIGSTVGANNLTLGGASTNVQIPGNLTVSGTTTTVNTDSLDVEDKNITVSKGGNDAVSEGAGITVDRTGTKGSLIYKAAAQNKFAIGDLGAEKDIATMFDITAANLSGVVTPANGGTGVSNNNAATLTRSGNHAVTLTTTDVTSVTLPTSGTLATTADITMANLTGTLVPSKGGTGVSNNDAATLTRSGNHALTLTTTAATGVTLPTAGTLATLAGSEQLSSKTLVEPVVDNFAAFNQESTPAAAAAGTVRVYAKSDNKLYKMDSTGAEAAIGSGSGSGGVNYLIDWYDATKPIGTVSTVAANGNIVVSGSAPAVTSAWYADATSGAAAIAASTSTLLRGSSNYLTALSGVSTSGATFVQSPAFNIDGSDLGKPVTISFDVSGVTTLDDWDVVVARYTVSGTTGTFAELIPVAGNASSITGTTSAEIPTGTVQFNGFFIPSATATDVYSLRFRRRAGATQIRIDSLTVGPQSLAQGAVVTAWQDYTPTLSGFTVAGLNALNSGKWRRVGDSIEIAITTRMGATGTASGTFTWSLPTGLTIDTSKLPASGSGIRAMPGSIVWFDRSAAIFVNAVPSAEPPAGIIATVTGSGALISNANVPSNSDDSFSISMKLPVLEWSSGTTTLADRAVEEYGWNNNLANADSTTKSTDEGYGPTGARIPNVSTSNKIKRVWFQSPILETDSLQLEIKWGGQWLPIGNTGLGPVNSTTLGMAIDDSNITSTSCDVVFGSAGFGASTGVAAGGWATLGGSDNYKWRVRKVSGGAAVGFPVSARNIVGDTSGTAVPTGYVGEVLTSSGTQTGSASGTITVNMGTGVTLTPGTWIVQGWSEASVQAARRLEAYIIDGSNALLDDSNGFKWPSTISDQSNAGNIMRTNTGNYYFRVAAGSTQIVKTQGTAVWPSAGGTMTLRIQAVRIA